VFENRLLRRIFGPKREEVAEGWRTLNNKKLYNVNKSKKTRWVGHVVRKWGRRKVYRLIV
jgi:hypothetical protein